MSRAAGSYLPSIGSWARLKPGPRMRVGSKKSCVPTSGVAVVSVGEMYVPPGDMYRRIESVNLSDP
eukprot:CAMPEP_0182943144 /NCGR_PEP_ID=MMETSP0105_2-20130417/51902_1 /TAXON_ID=81532 ORGANISM="Acanthoeca-like sp., Strain 10tr" /NCGR_SAMPLE_ID=MMETSP0105_2 /ASSEMBLY_ACC=CAM_ASM_000205 /LENGTH=65 /DNA_ID=CAMNT_0025082961 /DNA_START=104 /DNA_END=297 /DNA_ORIENTATION=+